ncbi:MAG TPA: hypothetical protein PKO28_02170 [Bacilli bacterium]|nr:hypothetical protein [Bacilli bacterium]
MNINVIRLRTILDDRESSVIKTNTDFIEEINNNLIDEDFIISENPVDPVMSIIFVETGGSEPKFLSLFEKLENPIVLLSNGTNNSLPACLEIKTYCSLHNKEAYIITGTEEQCANEIKHFARVAHAMKALKENNLGVIGQPSEWLIASQMDAPTVYDYFKINLINIGMDELIQEIDKKKTGTIPHLDKLKAKFKNREVLEGACFIYGALKRLIAKYHLRGLTIRCFDLLGKYKNTACLALALLNEEGITAACEGDVPSLLTMHMLTALTGRPCFQANPSRLDLENNTALFAHCTIPLNMVSKYDLLTHFESDLGVGIKGTMPLDKVTICKLFLNGKKLLDNSFVSSGKIKENCSLPGYCRTQILVEFDQYGLYTLFQKNFGNHMIITYADAEEDFFTLLTIYEKQKENH